MTTKPLPVLLICCFFLFSCGQLDNNDNSSEPPVNTTAAFAVQPMQVLYGTSLRLSYIGKTVTDTSIFYQVVSTYQGKSVGFNLSLPTEERARARFSSRGGVSDDFLHVLQKLYGIKGDSAIRFRADAWADCINLSKVYKADSGYVAGAQNKLFFRDAADSVEPELLLNVDDKEHWIELLEKDSIYRAPILRYLTQPYGK